MSRNRKLDRSATRQLNSIAERKRKWIRLAVQLNGYSYDTAGRLIQQTMPNGQTVGYQLDANGNRTQLIYPDGYYAEYAYDELNRLTAISLNGSSTFAVSFEYDQLSRTTQMTYDNGCVCKYTYALNNDMSDQDFSFAGSSASFDYFYNRVHQIIGLVPSDSSFFWTPSSSSTIDYATANNLNQYPSVGSTGYSYDGNGCLTGGPQSTTFDSLSRVTQIVSGGTTNDYWTDPLNRQARKSVNGTDTNYLYDGNQLIATYDDSGELISRFICGDGIDEHFINITSSGNVYLHMDRIGSVIAETDASGGVLNKFAFSPFGESSSVSSSNFGYTGQRYDSEIGLYNYKMRYYSPTIGRFLQPDPLGYEAGDLNMYTYVGNDGLNLTDPLGLNPDGTSYKDPADEQYKITSYSAAEDEQYKTTSYSSSGDYTNSTETPPVPDWVAPYQNAPLPGEIGFPYVSTRISYQPRQRHSLLGKIISSIAGVFKSRSRPDASIIFYALGAAYNDPSLSREFKSLRKTYAAIKATSTPPDLGSPFDDPGTAPGLGAQSPPTPQLIQNPLNPKQFVFTGG